MSVHVHDFDRAFLKPETNDPQTNTMTIESQITNIPSHTQHRGGEMYIERCMPAALRLRLQIDDSQFHMQGMEGGSEGDQPDAHVPATHPGRSREGAEVSARAPPLPRPRRWLPQTQSSTASCS